MRPLSADTLVGVDFDDTLVANQEHFGQAIDDLCQLLQERFGVSPTHGQGLFAAQDRLHHTHGRHRNRFLLAILATWCAAARHPAVPLEDLPRLAALAASPYDAPPTPHAGVRQALVALRAAFAGPLLLVTTGDPVVQAGRVQRSGLAGAFDRICILPEKTPEAFAGLGRDHRHRIMIGNAPRTDILPALQAGFEPLWVRAPTWDLDQAPVPHEIPTFATFPHAVQSLLA